MADRVLFCNNRSLERAIALPVPWLPDAVLGGAVWGPPR
jgi:hypothetical protein